LLKPIGIFDVNDETGLPNPWQRKRGGPSRNLN
jgi:hypothetical protein